LSREKLVIKCASKFSAVHLARVEKGTVKNPGIEIIKAIANALKITVNDLL